MSGSERHPGLLDPVDQERMSAADAEALAEAFALDLGDREPDDLIAALRDYDAAELDALRARWGALRDLDRRRIG